MSAVVKAMEDQGVTRAELSRRWARGGPGRKRTSLKTAGVRIGRFFPDAAHPDRKLFQTDKVALFLAEQLGLPYFQYTPETLEEAADIEAVRHAHRTLSPEGRSFFSNMIRANTPAKPNPETAPPPSGARNGRPRLERPD